LRPGHQHVECFAWLSSSDTMDEGASVPTTAVGCPLPPATIDAVDAAWLQAALAHLGINCEIDALSHERIGEGLGFSGQIYRLVPRYRVRGSAPESLVIKLSGASGEEYYHSRALSLIEPEVHFYREVAPKLKARIPRCYYAEIGSGVGALLLEDVSGFRCGNQRDGTSADDCRRAIRWLANFHADHWGTDRSSFPMLPDQADVQRSLAASMQEAIPVFRSHFGSALAPTAIELITRSMTAFGEGRTVGGLPQTILHIDFKPNNIFFGPADEIVVLDWQSPSFGNAVYDLTFFIASALTPEQRAASEHDLVRYYSSVLADRGIALPDHEEIFDSYRRNYLGVLAITGLVVRFGADDAASDAFRRNRVARAAAAIADPMAVRQARTMASLLPPI
jgi:aminoglycoside/choline kinase family phosphotransferase